jgi:hypothetical protein
MPWVLRCLVTGARAQGEAEELEEGSGCKLGVVLATRGWAAAFDDDDELVYDPATTAALILSKLGVGEWATGSGIQYMKIMQLGMHGLLHPVLWQCMLQCSLA